MCKFDLPRKNTHMCTLNITLYNTLKSTRLCIFVAAARRASFSRGSLKKRYTIVAIFLDIISTRLFNPVFIANLITDVI